MLDTLLESNAARPRRTGGTLASTLVHAALFAGAITVTTRDPAPKPAPPTEYVLPPVVVPRPAAPPPAVTRPTAAARPASAPVAPRLPSVDRVPNEVPAVVDVNIVVATDDEAAGGFGLRNQSAAEGLGALVGPTTREGALDERYVDRVPRIVGSPAPPEFPFVLRERGVGGRVAIQFVVDTLGRAEMHGLRVVEASDSLFARSVRTALPRYRFTPGEVRGQKVRTLVQLPFDFTLVR